MLKKAIQSHLAEAASRPLRIRELTRDLAIPEADYPAFRHALKELVHEGRVVRLKGGRYGAPKRHQLVTGHLSATPHGYGFVIPEGGGDDVYVGSGASGGAMHNDVVLCRVLRRTPKGLEGRIEKVLRRANETIVGYLRRERNVWFVEPEDAKLSRDVVVDRTRRGTADEDDLVVVRIESWGSDHRNPVGRIVEVLGRPDDPEIEMKALVRRAGLTESFSPEVEQEAERVAGASLQKEIARRRDLRGEVIFTIDPRDARDFDDAISLDRLPDGRWRLGIHIADVAHYVEQDSRLDQEAWHRGTSVYLVDRVIPMLPESLSNQACSLRPRHDRLAFTCWITLGTDGDPGEVELADTVIHSRARLTYEDAQAIIEQGQAPPGTDTPPEVVQTIVELATLSERLTRRRRARGSIDFDLPEPIIELGPEGVPVGIEERPRLASHRLVEECMIVANEAVARYALERGYPFIFRVHDAPDPDRMEEFKEFASSLGFPLPGRGAVRPSDLNALLADAGDSPVEPLLNKVLLRHMRQALYSTDNPGHFGLASEAYAHFTSPIRRYPDLAIHRLLRRYALQGAPRGREREHQEGRLRRTCEQASQRERAAMEAERESIKLKQVVYMESRVGETFDGVISGVTAFGLFVELNELLVDGLIHISELDDDYYVLEEKHYRLIGERTGQVYRLGDPIRITVVRADRATRRLDFVIAGEPMEASAPAPESAEADPTRGANENTSVSGKKGKAPSWGRRRTRKGT